MSWPRRCVALLGAAANVVVLAWALPANAENQASTGVVRYEGQLVSTTDSGASSTSPAAVTISCADGACKVGGIVSLDGGPVLLKGTSVQQSRPASGSLCDGSDEPAQTLSVTATASAVTVVQKVLPTAEQTCGQGSTVRGGGVTRVTSAARVSGDFCVVQSTCEESPIESDESAGTLIYQGERVVANEGGATTTDSVTISIRCVDKACTMSGIVGVDLKPLVLTGTSIQQSQPQFGDVCGASYSPSSTLTVTVTASTLTSTYKAEKSEVKACDTGTLQRLSLTSVTKATLVSGEFCYVERTCVVSFEGSSGPLGGASSDGGSLGVADPSSLSALATVEDAVTVRNLVWAAAMTVVLVLLIAFPTSLLNSATETGTDRISKWWAARKPHTTETQPATTPRWARIRERFSDFQLAAGGIIVASIISSFVSPDFGFNTGSVRVFASIAVSFILEVAIGWAVLIWLVRRTHPDAKPTYHFKPISLLMVVAAVIFSRVTGFQPGIVFGLVAGVAFATLITTAHKARLTLTSLGWAFALATVGWIGYSMLSNDGQQSSAVVAFIRETFSAMTVGGIVALPLTLIPLRGLSGHAVYTWNRTAWGLAYSAGLIGFFLVLMPMPISWGEVPFELWTWITLYLAYSTIAATLWAAITQPWKPKDEEAPQQPLEQTQST
ncbi:hypothetical protein BH09ACT10_BH09ACT10_02000 [soil metagenome]